nr:ATP-binding protein [Acinetobacter amyesii]
MSSSWKFATEWIHSPSATQCLNLTRVAEETLTNILKHSQASKVHFSLCETETQLVLRIEDNGIGFNPNDVEQGLHVGLHSMQTRIHRIGGEFKIQSQPGSTVLEAILPFKSDGADSEDLDEKTA